MSKRSRSILLALTSYYTDFHKGVARFAIEHGWHLDASVSLNHWIHRAWDGDGVITDNETKIATNSPVTELLATLKQPRVTLGQHVRCNDDRIGQLAAEFFLARGYRNFASFWFGGHTRSDGFCRTLALHGVHDCTVIKIPSRCPLSERLTLLQRALTDASYPLALFALEDMQGVEVIDAALMAGLRVPDDVAVLGVDNAELVCLATAPPLSSIDTDLENMGYETAAVLEAHLQGAPLPDTPIIIEPRGVVARQSTDVLAVSHPEVAKALKFIWANYKRDIHVQDVVAATALSERSLYEAFERHVRAPIKHHIRNARVEHARRLLQETNMKVRAVAAESGFRGPARLHSAFQSTFNTTPAAWRRKHSVLRIEE